jgi:hydrogenase maturation factor
MNDIPENAQSYVCPSDSEHHCLTCSDEAVMVKVICVDQQSMLACVEVGGQREEIDITLVDDVLSGDLLLAHAGVAIARLEGGRIHAV